MKALQIGLVGLLLVVTACATNVGQWHGESAKLDAKALQADVEESLKAASYSLQPTEQGLNAMKAAEKGRQTWMFITFTDTPGGGSKFDLIGKSNNRWNLVTFGIMGFSLRHSAWNDCSEWYEAWSKAHPK